MLLAREHIGALRGSLERGTSLSGALALALRGVVAAGGMWRFYSDLWPGEGMEWWNVASPWRRHWAPYLPKGLFAFGEDVFGNQLVVMAGHEAAHLVDHENAECHSLYVHPIDLLQTVMESGVDWVDFYSGGALEVARKLGECDAESHLHWTTPLILGGPLTASNVTVVPRDEHHIGHARLWAQLSGLPPGTTVVL